MPAARAMFRCRSFLLVARTDNSAQATSLAWQRTWPLWTPAGDAWFGSLAAGVGARRRVALDRFRELGGLERRAVKEVLLARRDRVQPEEAQHLDEDRRP